MPDLVFATRGQAEALAAQESIARKAREARAEFEEGAKATKSWDAAQMQLKRSAESALRSVQTEQGKIAEQIDRIKAAQASGLVPPQQAEMGIAKLRQRWLDVDAATKAATVDAGAFNRELVTAHSHSSRLGTAIEHAFDPVKLIKWAGHIVGVMGALHAIKSSIEDIGEQIEKRAGRQLKGYDEASKTVADYEKRKADAAKQAADYWERHRMAWLGGEKSGEEFVRNNPYPTEFTEAPPTGAQQRVQRLQPRKTLEESIGGAAQTRAELASTEYLSKKGIADLNELLSHERSQPWRWLQSWGTQHYYPTRQDAIAIAEEHIKNLSSTHPLLNRHRADELAGNMIEGRPAIEQRRAELKLWQEMLNQLKAISSKLPLEGGIPVGSE